MKCKWERKGVAEVEEWLTVKERYERRDKIREMRKMARRSGFKKHKDRDRWEEGE